LYNWILAKVKHLLFISPKLGVPTPLEHSLRHYLMSKAGNSSLPKHELFRDFKDNYIITQYFNNMAIEATYLS
jgi:hypothetical protein